MKVIKIVIYEVGEVLEDFCVQGHNGRGVFAGNKGDIRLRDEEGNRLVVDPSALKNGEFVPILDDDPAINLLIERKAKLLEALAKKRKERIDASTLSAENVYGDIVDIKEQLDAEGLALAVKNKLIMDGSPITKLKPKRTTGKGKK